MSFVGFDPDGRPCCIHCGTPITFRLEVGWTHDWGFTRRGGCEMPEGRFLP